MIFFRLLILFTAVPLIELYILIKAGARIGALSTIAIVILTGIVGAYLAKLEGLSVISKIRLSVQAGIFPGDELFDGILILSAGALLLTPGFITDGIGFILLIPWTRELVKDYLKKRVRQKIDLMV
ncbi:MAG: FxsA family protein [Fidelibacterota bacterium]